MMKYWDYLYEKISYYLQFIYVDVVIDILMGELVIQFMNIIGLNNEEDIQIFVLYQNYWDEQDIVMIIYGDSVMNQYELLLFILYCFLYIYCKSIINKVYILLFYLFSLDDGFLVINYFSVNEGFGIWLDIYCIVVDYGLMFDLVINYCLLCSVWFDNFIKGEGFGSDFFMIVDLFDDLFEVI